MTQIKLLDCTLRDGGLVNNGEFSDVEINEFVACMTSAQLDYVEVGYLNGEKARKNSTYFDSVQTASEFLPSKENRRNTKFTLMADIGRCSAKMLTERDVETVDGIRVAFYKHQIKEALEFCSAAELMGYDVFLQPMVTVDYTLDEYARLLDKFLHFNLYAVAVVDSFGYITQQEIMTYMNMLEQRMNKSVRLGFHGHNNMQLALLNAMALFDYSTEREIIIDASVMGIGRGAGNLNLELICNIFNQRMGEKYSLVPILDAASKIIDPISRKYSWGYSPYYLLTAMKKCHQCFAQYLFENHYLSICDFAKYLDTIPPEMKTKCTRPYVEKLYASFLES